LGVRGMKEQETSDKYIISSFIICTVEQILLHQVGYLTEINARCAVNKTLNITQLTKSRGGRASGSW
jgi:hypothetical protein